MTEIERAARQNETLFMASLVFTIFDGDPRMRKFGKLWVERYKDLDQKADPAVSKPGRFVPVLRVGHNGTNPLA